MSALPLRQQLVDNLAESRQVAVCRKDEGAASHLIEEPLQLLVFGAAYVDPVVPHLTKECCVGRELLRAVASPSRRPQQVGELALRSEERRVGRERSARGVRCTIENI